MDWHGIPDQVRGAVRRVAELLSTTPVDQVMAMGHFPEADGEDVASTLAPYRPFTGLAPTDEEAFSDAVAIERNGTWEIEVPLYAGTEQTDLDLYVTVDANTGRALMTDVLVP